MITRDFGKPSWRAGCAGAPPGLDVVPDNPEAGWYPLPRIVMFPQPPGPQAVAIPIAAPVGDDPTDPGAQSEPRYTTPGMIAWLDSMARIRVGTSGARK